MSNFSNEPAQGEIPVFRGGDAPINPADLAALVEKYNSLKEDSKDQRNWITGGFVALVFVVVGMLISLFAIFNDYLSNKQATFQDLKDQVTAQNAKMDLLIQEYGKKK